LLNPTGSTDDQTLGESLRPMFSRHIQELRRLIGKFREGTLTMEEALGGYAFFYTIFPFLIIPLLSGYSIDTEAQWDEDNRINFITAFFFILFFIIVVTLLSRSIPRQPSSSIKFYRFIGSIISAGVLSLGTIWYFPFWNAVSSNGEKVLVRGLISHMDISQGGRYIGRPHYITIRYHERDIKLTVSPQEYENLNLGQTYSREMKLGGLGYYYNWGSSWWK
jgi:hypothetical protein